MEKPEGFRKAYLLIFILECFIQGKIFLRAKKLNCSDIVQIFDCFDCMHSIFDNCRHAKNQRPVCAEKVG